jgi:hypothetical protein
VETAWFSLAGQRLFSVMPITVNRKLFSTLKQGAVFMFTSNSITYGLKLGRYAVQKVPRWLLFALL